MKLNFKADALLNKLPLTLCILESPKRVLLQIVMTSISIQKVKGEAWTCGPLVSSTFDLRDIDHCVWEEVGLDNINYS